MSFSANMDNKDFDSNKHVSLLPNREEATLGNLIKEFFFHRDISNSNLLSHNIPEEKENKYLHKWIIFISLFVQILLKRMSNPMQKFGSKFEDFLNGNIFEGKEQVSKRENSCSLTILGHLDKRIELDKEIKHEDCRYYPALSMMAAKVAYENKCVIKEIVFNRWKMEFVDFYDFYNEFQQRTTTQAFIMHEKIAKTDTIIVAFRGTSPFDANDWSTDFDFSWLKIDGMGKLHKGFMMALGLQKCFPENTDDELGDYRGYWPKQIEHDDKHPLAYYTIREKLREMMANNRTAKFIVTGHSLGGALAILFPAILALHGEVEMLERLEAIYTYGQPRVGDEKFGEFMKKNLREHKIKYYRIVYGYDMVPTVPFDNTLMTFKHFGTCIHFNSFYQGKIVEEEQQKPFTKEEQEHHWMKYLRFLREMVAMFIRRVLAWLNAVWLFVRSFIIGYALGTDYKEGWVLKGARFLEILVPGTMEHFPQDYVNATRLASKDLFKNYPALPQE